MQVEEGGRAIGKRVKRGVQNRLAQNLPNLFTGSKNNSTNTTMASSVLHNTGSSILNHNDDYSSGPQNNSQQKLKLQKNQINY